MTAASAREYRCPAKVNLTLEVLHRRPDGYHELASLMAPLSLADTLRVAPGAQISCLVRGPTLPGDANLVMRAARLLAAEAGVVAGARCTLTKRIPLAAGLGGGSSDAASALVALDRLWDTGLSPARLARLALQLGSDVPFFLHGRPGLVRGRGEVVEPLQRWPPLWLVLLVPAHAVADKTATLFARLIAADFSDGGRTQRTARRLESGGQLSDGDLVNVFERAARLAFPALQAAWQAAEARTGRAFHLSGAGPALFALAADAADARALMDRLAALAGSPLVTRTLVCGSPAADR